MMMTQSKCQVTQNAIHTRFNMISATRSIPSIKPKEMCQFRTHFFFFTGSCKIETDTHISNRKTINL